MKYCHKKYYAEFKLFYIGKVLTLEIYLPGPPSLHRLGHNILVATRDVTGMVKQHGTFLYYK